MSRYRILNNMCYKINEDDSLTELGKLTKGFNIIKEVVKHIDKDIKETKEKKKEVKVKTAPKTPKTSKISKKKKEGK